MVEIKEVLRAGSREPACGRWGSGKGVDRKTARATTCTAGVDAVDDDLIAAVVSAIRPVHPHGHGAVGVALLGPEEQIRAWVNGDGEDTKPLSLVKNPRNAFQEGCACGAEWYRCETVVEMDKADDLQAPLWH